MSINVCKGWILAQKRADIKNCDRTENLNENGYCTSHLSQYKVEEILNRSGKVCSNRFTRGCYNEIFDDISQLCSKCYPRKTNKCIGKTKTGSPCPNFGKNDGDYCEKHIPEIEEYSDEENTIYKCELWQLKSCPKKVSIKNTRCNKCKETYCWGIIKEEKYCTNLKISGTTDFCRLHAKQEVYFELLKDNKKVCSNSVRRGCYNEVLDDFARCNECRQKERVSSNARYQVRKDMSEQYNSENSNQKMCKYCPNIVEKLINDKCYKCYDSFKRANDNRVRDPLDVKIYEYHSNATKRGIKWELTKEQTIELFNLPCGFCGQLDNLNGIDRIDNKLNYTLDNTVSCCAYCNSMKHDLDLEIFIRICGHIAYMNGYSSGITDFKIIPTNNPASYSTNSYNAKRRGINMKLTKEQHDKLQLQNCTYCKKSNAGGIDRVDSGICYTETNCVPCCYNCNRMKSVCDDVTFLLRCKTIYELFNIRKSNTDLSYKDVIKKNIPKLYINSNVVKFNRNILRLNKESDDKELNNEELDNKESDELLSEDETKIKQYTPKSELSEDFKKELIRIPTKDQPSRIQLEDSLKIEMKKYEDCKKKIEELKSMIAELDNVSNHNIIPQKIINRAELSKSYKTTSHNLQIGDINIVFPKTFGIIKEKGIYYMNWQINKKIDNKTDRKTKKMVIGKIGSGITVNLNTYLKELIDRVNKTHLDVNLIDSDYNIINGDNVIL